MQEVVQPAKINELPSFVDTSVVAGSLTILKKAMDLNNSRDNAGGEGWTLISRKQSSVKSWADMVEEEGKVSSPPMSSKLNSVTPAFVPRRAMILPSLAAVQLMAQISAPLNVSVSNIQLTPTNVLHALVSYDMKKLKDMNNPTKSKPIGIAAKRYEP
ncbi:hypothetical protein RND71_035692 [Anisodus tanguticus]|uniref:Uncharacterized protein n=1 Tax=Anisodus tanguticus TaxID=243964 RepID=A0AAE1R5Z7_9SOLA|nr:hypothetical protein RND71_035692 [Anisodus tanguticus]